MGKVNMDEGFQEQGEKYLDKIINNIGDPVFVKDDQSRMVLVNEAFCKIFKLSREEIIGKTLAEDVPPDEREHFLRIDRQVLADGQDNLTEELLTVRGGATRTISTKKTRYIDDAGKKFLIGVIHDITDQKILEKQLQDKMAALENVNKSMMGRELRIIELKERIKELEAGQDTAL
ncbi:MAG: PAS domain S-box protein [Candidatus Omnitrophica bacterium]|nr:PAS domain S-box protein [Candidatus Omnitrophota bacterium]